MDKKKFNHCVDICMTPIMRYDDDTETRLIRFLQLPLDARIYIENNIKTFNTNETLPEIVIETREMPFIQKKSFFGQKEILGHGKVHVLRNIVQGNFKKELCKLLFTNESKTALAIKPIGRIDNRPFEDFEEEENIMESPKNEETHDKSEDIEDVVENEEEVLKIAIENHNQIMFGDLLGAIFNGVSQMEEFRYKIHNSLVVHSDGLIGRGLSRPTYLERDTDHIGYSLGIHLGKSVSMEFRWSCKGKKTGKKTIIELHDGDMYIMAGDTIGRNYIARDPYSETKLSKSYDMFLYHRIKLL